MADTQNTVTVGTSATLVVSPNTWRRGFNIYNNGSVVCYIGLTSTVLTTTGTPLLPQASFTSDGLNNYKGTVYMISGSSGQDIRYLEWTM